MRGRRWLRGLALARLITTRATPGLVDLGLTVGAHAHALLAVRSHDAHAARALNFRAAVAAKRVNVTADLGSHDFTAAVSVRTWAGVNDRATFANGVLLSSPRVSASATMCICAAVCMPSAR